MLRRDREIARTTRDRLTALAAPRAPEGPPRRDPRSTRDTAAHRMASAGPGWVPDPSTAPTAAPSPTTPPPTTPPPTTPPPPASADGPRVAPAHTEPTAAADPPTRTTAALRVAAAVYTATHGDPVARSPAPRRRIRWAVPWRLAVAAGAVVLLVAGGVALRAASLAPGPAVTLPTPAPGGPAAPAPTTTATAEVVVDVVGAVAAPGVVRLPRGSRVVDAIAAAGGATGEALVSALNLARVLVDGEQIVVPRPGEQPGGADADAQADADPTVDLNTADVAALDALPGIGPVLAERIVTHREGAPFASVDELADVAGIGPTLLERLRDLVRV